ncbi:MAG: flavodoxin [Abditibacteriota bacterium]|nr:flavodoxin [Abditibacteriota bacterium]
MIRILTVISVLLLFALTVCGCNGKAETAKTGGPAQNAPSAAGADASKQEKDVLVVYFSATGTTKGVAEKIAKITGGDLREIKPAKEYTGGDLDWNDPQSRSTKEQNDPSARPEIGGEPVSLNGYSVVYVGYPIWFGQEPRIMDTFAESCSFDGVAVIPFCTSGSSGIGKSGKNLAKTAGSGNWLDGKRFGAGASEQEIRSWIDGLQQKLQNVK